MKKIFYVTLFLIHFSMSNAQNWTNFQISAANTARNIEYLTNIEKNAILYINLCRLYPRQFMQNEVLNYFGTPKYGDYLKNSAYRKSLINYLNTMQAVKALYFNINLYNNAQCFAKEQGIAGTVGHKRINCAKGNYAECCSYGMDTGKDIAMQWLIDDRVPSLGHRLNCLNNSYNYIGLSVSFHKTYAVCAVADFY